MSVAAFLVMCLALIVVMLVRSREVALWQVIVIGLFGFYLARTELAGPISAAVLWVVSGLTHTY